MIEGRTPRARYQSSEITGGLGHPLLFGFAPAQDFGPWPDGGGYPHGFLSHAYKTLRVNDPDRVLHICSGSMQRGVRIDIRASAQPTVRADARRLPFRDSSFDAIMADPPYGADYADTLYGTRDDYPSPGLIAREAARVLRPGGFFGILHFLIPHAPLQYVRSWGVMTGLGYAIRAWSVYHKPVAPGLFASILEGGEDDR